MTLSMNQPYSKPFFGKGVFVNEASIYAIEDVSGTTPHPLTNPVDIGVRLTLDIGRDFQPEMLIAGNFKKNEIGEIIGWGSAFPVQEFFSKLGYKGTLNPDNTIPEEALEEVLEKKFLRLSYVSGSKNNGKAHYSDWNIVTSIDDGAESLAKRFHSSVAKGYPKNYRPDALDDQPVANHATESESVEEGNVF
ncbi:MAG: hypothetical protein ACOYNS_17565 [Bacteroidota bacterium]